MSKDFKHQILSILVDWYENSPAYVRNQEPARRRMMRLYDNGQTDFVVYDIENHIVRKDINQAVLELSCKDFVGYEWMRGQENHILSKLWLNFAKIEQIYGYLKRRPKGDTVDGLLLQLTELRNKAKEEWIRRWLEDTIDVISRKRSIGNSLPTNKTECDDLLKSISCLMVRSEIETLERVFSIQCFGDSKRFGRSVKARLVRILKKYLVQDDCTDEAALRMVGIVRYPEQFNFSGALSIMMPDGEINFSPLPFGGTLGIEDVKLGVITLGVNIKRILSIENRANYVEYVHKFQDKNDFVIFHGGHFSPAKRVFLQAIASSMPDNCVFHHWGDIDYGGFCMLARLRREIFPDIKSWRMNEQELMRYSKFTASFSDTYGKRLASLLEAPELYDCTSCIKLMLNLQVRLEQEAILVQA